MSAPEGNRFWEKRSKHGRDKIFKTPEELWNAAVEYFEWVIENPLQEDVFHQGKKSETPKSLMRATSIEGFCLHIGVNSGYLYDFEKNLDESTQDGKDFSEVIKMIKEAMRVQKIEGASAGLLNANIIARDLGLADTQKKQVSFPEGVSFNMNFGTPAPSGD